MQRSPCVGRISRTASVDRHRYGEFYATISVSVTPAKSGTPFTRRSFQLSKSLRMAVTKATNSAWYSVYGWASIYCGRYYKHKEFAILWTGKCKPCSTTHFQQRFLVNVSCGLLGNKLTWHVFSRDVTRSVSWFFLEKELPLYLEDMPLAKRGRICLEHERAPPHFGREKTEFFSKLLKEDGLEQ